MLFNSFHFLLFFITVTSIYFALPHQHRWWWLLISSCFFYMIYIPVFICILGFTIFVDYFAGIFIEQANGKKRKYFLILSLLVNIGVLVTFKYFNFFNQNFTELLQGLGFQNPIPFLKIALPIGLSFHTFQAMSYTIEVYRGHQKAERHLGIYALYVMFYPQLVAGPIERPQNLLHQFREKYSFDYLRVTSGLKLMAWGLFKKAVIADRLAIAVDSTFDHPESFNSFSLIITTFFFSFQILCDFSGYSDMAIGAARIMGFKLMKNFDNPYQSGNVQEFWKRWHISLSGWFKDYLYLPLGGNRVKIPRWYLNLMIVFLISGLWHGANWNFLAWGLLHGLFMIVFLASEKIRMKFQSLFGNKIWSTLSVITTFSLITFAFIFFRAKNWDTAIYIIKKILVDFPRCFESTLHLNFPIENIGLSKFNYVISFLLIILLWGVQRYQSKINFNEYLYRKPAILRWSFYCFLIMGILYLGIFENRDFIYFQF